MRVPGGDAHLLRASHVWEVKCWIGLCLDGDFPVFGIPLDDAVLQCEEGMVSPDADVLARAHPCAALAYEDAASAGGLPPVEFNAEALCI